jgi:hypothetical protein
MSLLEEGKTEPPVTEGFVRGWLAAVQGGRSSETADRLRTLPYLDLLLPAVFEIDGIGDDLSVGGFDDGRWDDTPRFPGAVAELVAGGRLDRGRILDATLDRLIRGDRPMHLKPFILLHDALAPTAEEIAGHAADYGSLLARAPSPVATVAQRALRAADDAGLLELETLLEVSAAALGRGEKTLVRVQVAWLDAVAGRTPERAGEILETVAVAFGHPALDVQERALEVIARRLADVGMGGSGQILADSGAGSHRPVPPDAGAGGVAARLGAAAGVLSGRLAVRAAALFGTPRPAATELLSAPALPPVASPAEMPPPIASAAELAEEVAALLHGQTAARWERVLAAVTSLPDDGLTESLGPVLDRHPAHFTERYGRVPFLGAAIGARIGREHSHVMRERLLGIVRRSWTDVGGGMDRSLINTPSGLLTLRVAEVATQLSRSPVPVLLATPSHVTGSLDAGVLIDRLARCEAEGREPWQLDLQQAMLRVPRSVGPGVLARAEALTSASGQRLAAWLRTGGLPDPVSTRFEQRSTDADGRVVSRRVVVNLESGRSDDGWILLEDALVTVNRRPRPEYHVITADEPDVLAMVLPHHREAVAAWALPELAALADQDSRDATLLPLVAESSGPIGPAMVLALAYGLGARHSADRVAAVDALLTLAVRPEPFAGALGESLGDLCADGTVKVSRVAQALGDAHRAGGSAVVWEVLATALPLLLPAAPRGLPDLVELATVVAGAVGARGEIERLAEVAARRGGSRLVREARRLQAAVS